MLTASDFKGVYGILATPAKAGADRWDATDTVDLDETARLTEKLIQDGCSGLLALGTTGECATLTEAEFEAFADCLLSTVDKRVPTFVGATTLGTHDTVRRMRFLRDHGADGTMLGLPMWQACSEEQAVKFYASISEAFPDMAIMVYANAYAFRFPFPPSFWAAVTKAAPTVTSAKFGNPVTYLDCVSASEGKINFLPIDMMALAFAQQSPDTMTAIWATAACMGPQPCLALMDAIEAKDMDRAGEISKDILWANETFIPNGDFDEFSKFNLQLEKIRFNAAGYCNAGPIRPPYDVVPEQYAENARECGRRWSELVKKYSSDAS
ncbi:dihydrodipicolinate synthase family protein [Mycobacterium sp. Y57]|uniref:dihydrodipicolinate synthase family protein n=1 Tax=Mycolicibacterium xanthum TaxID=2796469 RepID=UPI001C8465E7|nr:dihydrodipicolinate synthase family protein [Mycolicibacterium xanthum]MBX7430512.1 dihydrodipicolinate synthase family protein [Mycolicibacterium xanthum]